MMPAKEPFERLEHLGTGGFAQTWKVRVVDPDLLEEWKEPEVAVKIPLTKQKERVLRKELELTGSLHLQLTEVESVNIVGYLGFEIFDGRLVMVMKYVNSNLRNLIGKIGRWTPLEVNRGVTIARGILNGLAVIHDKNIMHRDIKPENILMENDTPKITDFGIGRMLRSNELASSTVGTLYYMSPELLYNESGATFNTDIWSLGITLYEMLCGGFPFGIAATMPPGLVIDKIRDKNIALEFPAAARLPPPLRQILKKALVKDPAGRYQTAGEMRRDLEDFLSKGDEGLEKEIAAVRPLLTDPVRVPEAEKKLQELLHRHPDAPSVYLCLGELYNRCEDFDRAVAVFLQGIEKEPAHAMLHWGLGIAYQKKGELQPAVEALEKALALGLDSSLERYARALLMTWERELHKT